MGEGRDSGGGERGVERNVGVSVTGVGDLDMGGEQQSG